MTRERQQHCLMNKQLDTWLNFRWKGLPRGMWWQIELLNVAELVTAMGQASGLKVGFAR